MKLRKNHKKILNDVKRIDFEAGEWLQDQLIKFYETDVNPDDIFLLSSLEETEDINDMIHWSATPQGRDFWYDIYIAMGDLLQMNRNGANS